MAPKQYGAKMARQALLSQSDFYSLMLLFGVQLNPVKSFPG